MPTHSTWLEIVVRLAIAAAAGMAVGYVHEARSQAAGLRTTTLVWLSACLSMVLAELLLTTTVGRADEYARYDVMRLPLGVLTGIGFIGAGAIVRREEVVIDVSTAATLWFMTIVGLTLGAGQLGLGVGVTLVTLAALWVLERVDSRIRRRFRAFLKVCAEPERLPEDEIRRAVVGSGQRIVAWAVTYRDSGESYEARAELQWYGRAGDCAQAPEFLRDLAMRAGAREVEWTPQASAL